MVNVCAGSALLAQTDEVMGRLLWRDLVESIELVLASCGTKPNRMEISQVVHVELVPWLEQPPFTSSPIPTTEHLANTTADGSSRAEPDGGSPSGQRMRRVGTACPDRRGDWEATLARPRGVNRARVSKLWHHPIEEVPC